MQVVSTSGTHHRHPQQEENTPGAVWQSWFWPLRESPAPCDVCVSDSVTPWPVARQAPLSMGFCRQGHWSGWLFPSPGDLPDPRIEPGSPALQAYSLPSEPPGQRCEGLRYFQCVPLQISLLIVLAQKEQHLWRQTLGFSPWGRSGEDPEWLSPGCSAAALSLIAFLSWFPRWMSHPLSWTQSWKHHLRLLKTSAWNSWNASLYFKS